MSFDIVVFHYPCHDGLGSAFVVNLYHKINNFTQPEYIPMQFNVELNIKKYIDKKVIFCDWSPPLNFLEQLEKVASQILILDHHITSKDNLESKSYAIFDMKRSGVGITWDYFFPDKEIPYYLVMIQDRDLWNWKLPDTKSFTSGLFTICSTINTFDFDKLFELFYELENEPEKINYYINIGSIICKSTDNKVNQYAKNALKKINKYQNYNVCIVNSTNEFKSELGNIIASDPRVDFAVIWCYNHINDEYYVSLRSCGSINVAQIAKTFGGGGHINAAGCTLKQNPIYVFVSE